MENIDTSNIKLNPLMDTLRLEKISDAVYFSEKYSDYISNSRLGLLQKQGPKAFFEGFSAQTGYNPSFVLGSGVHELTLQSSLFDMAPDMGKPTAKLGGMADYLYSSYLKNTAISNEDIIKASDYIDYYKGKMNDEKCDYVRSNCKNYWEKRKTFEEQYKGGKELFFLDSKMMSQCLGCINALRNNPMVMNLLTPTDDLGFPVIAENEQTILLDVEVNIDGEEPFIVRLKSKLDNYTIDKSSNTITVNDIKTTIKNVQQFGEVIHMYSYMREIAMYSFLLVLCAKQFFNMDNPTVKGNFLVVSTVPPYRTAVVPMTTNLYKEGFQQFKDLLRLACHYKKFGYDV